MLRQFTLALACTATTVLGLASAPAQAASFNLGQLITSNGSFTVGDKQFSNFACTIVDNGFSLPDSCGDILVNTLDNGPFGITFQSFFFAGPNSAIDTLLDFTVTALDPAKLIESVQLAFNGAFTGPLGFTNVTETVRDAANNEIIGQLFVSNPPTDLQDPGLEAGDFNLTRAVRQINVRKDIMLVAGNNSTASISFIDQRFEQTEVPEPGTVSGLLAVGAFGVGMMLKKRRSQSAMIAFLPIANDPNNNN